MCDLKSTSGTDAAAPSGNGDGRLETPGFSWRAGGGFIVIILLAAAAYCPLVMTSGVTEGDSTQILWATARSLQTSQGFDVDVPMYGRRKNAGYYQLFFWFYPDSLGLENLHVAMNWLNVFSITVAVVFFYWAFRKLFDPERAFMIAVVMMLCPALWDISGYGHPMGPAVCCLAIALLLLVSSPKRLAMRVLSSTLAIVFLAASVLFRGETLLAFPALAATPLLLGKDWRSMIRGVSRAGGLCVVAVVLYSLIMSRIPVRMEAAGQGSFESYVATFVTTYLPQLFDLRVCKGFGYWAVATGPFVGLLGMVGFIVMLRRRQWRVVVFVLAWIVPPVLVFLRPHTYPRYFILTLPGIACLATCPFWRKNALWRWFAVLAIVGVNYVGSMLMYHPVLKYHKSYYRNDLGRKTSLLIPLGGIVEHRMAADRLVARVRKDAELISSIDDRSVFAIGAGARSIRRLAYFITIRYPEVKWSTLKVAGKDVFYAKTRSNEFALLDRNDHDTPLIPFLREVARGGEFNRFFFHEFYSDEVADDPFELPAGLKRLEIGRQ